MIRTVEDILNRDPDIIAMLASAKAREALTIERCRAANTQYLPALLNVIAAAEQKARLLRVDHVKANVKIGLTGAWLLVNGTLVVLALPAGVAVAALSGIAVALGEIRSRLDKAPPKSIEALRHIAEQLKKWATETRRAAATFHRLIIKVAYGAMDAPTTAQIAKLQQSRPDQTRASEEQVNTWYRSYLDQAELLMERSINAMTSAQRRTLAAGMRTQSGALAAAERSLLTQLRLADAATS